MDGFLACVKASSPCTCKSSTSVVTPESGAGLGSWGHPYQQLRNGLALQTTDTSRRTIKKAHFGWSSLSISLNHGFFRWDPLELVHRGTPLVVSEPCCPLCPPHMAAPNVHVLIPTSCTKSLH